MPRRNKENSRLLNAEQRISHDYSLAAEMIRREEVLILHWKVIQAGPPQLVWVAIQKGTDRREPAKASPAQAPLIKPDAKAAIQTNAAL